MGILDTIKGGWRKLRGAVSGSGAAVLGLKDSSYVESIKGSMHLLDGVTPNFPIEFLGLLQKLVLITPDLSQAVKRSVNLSNTGLTFKLVGASDREQERAEAEIKALLRNHPGFLNRLLRQATISGAVSLEAIPNKRLDGLEEMRIVPVRKIRFRKILDRGLEKYVPYQILDRGGYRELNPTQYFYEAVELDEDNPYAIPPFLSALRAIFIGHDGASNIRDVMNRVGLMGFLAMLMRKRSPRPGEDPEAYQNNLEKELKEMRDSVGTKIRSGAIFGYDNLKIDYNSVSGDARGFQSVWQANEEQIASGIDLDPSLLGRSYSTTETYAGVVFEAFVAKLSNTRHPVESALKFALEQHLRFRGLRFERLSAEWGPDVSLNKREDAEAEKIHFEAIEKRDQILMARVENGIITIEEAAEEMGYDSIPSPRTGKFQTEGSGNVVPFAAKKKANAAVM